MTFARDALVVLTALVVFAALPWVVETAATALTHLVP